MGDQIEAGQSAFTTHPQFVLGASHRVDAVVRPEYPIFRRVVIERLQRIAVVALQSGIGANPYQSGAVLGNAVGVRMRQPVFDGQLLEDFVSAKVSGSRNNQAYK